MRHLFALGLTLCVAGSAAAQTEVIIRRPGQQDQVIRLDSARTREALAKVQAELQKATTAMSGRREILQHDPSHQAAFEASMRVSMLALKDAEIAATSWARRQPHLGILVATTPRETDKYGAYISAVTPGSPADKAGIISGDIIVKIAGKSLTEKNAKDDSGPGVRLISIVATLTVGKPVDVELRRGTQNKTVKITPTEDEASAIARMAPSVTDLSRLPLDLALRAPELPSRMAFLESPSFSVFGNGNGAFSYSFGSNGLFANVELAPLNEKLGSYFGTSEGVLVVNTGVDRPALVRGFRIDTARAAARSARVRRIEADSIDAPANGPVRAVNTIGLEPGDVILSVDGRTVTNPSQLMRIVGSYDHNDQFKLQIMRQKRAETLTVKMP